MLSLCEYYEKKSEILKAEAIDSDKGHNESMSSDGDSDDTSVIITLAAINGLDEPISLIERTAKWIKPIVEAVVERLANDVEIDVDDPESETKSKLDMWTVLGYLN